MNLRVSTFVCFLLLVSAGVVSAQDTASGKAARAEFARGRAAMKNPGFVEAIAAFRKAVELDPGYVEAHQQFIFTSMRARKPEEQPAVRQELLQLYQGWAEKHPDNAVLQWMLGDLCGKEKGKAEKYYLRAVSLNAKLPEVHMALSLIEETRGENARRLAYLKQAADSAPEDASYLFYYSNALHDSDWGQYRRLTDELLNRFPQHERSAQALYWLAFHLDDIQEKRAILERLRRDFPPAKSSWSRSGMEDLFDLYAEQAPAQALALAEELTSYDKENQTWAARLSFQRSVLTARSLIAERKFTEAATLLKGVALPRYTNGKGLHLTLAEALDAGGEPSQAFESLARVVAKEPTDALIKALNHYGEKSGRTAAQIDAELRRLRDEQASPFKEFTLAGYRTEAEKISLADYRGKVVLVDFWYPTCGPCRGESPNLQKALAKYGPQGFVILAINLEPDEDEMVLPYLQNNRYGFLPLKSNWDWARETYGVRGAPTNFLIDRDGRMVFKPGVVRSAAVYRTFELQIEALLARPASAK